MTEAGNLDPTFGVALYRRMLRLRRFEERVVELLDANEIAAHAHECVGQEAVAVGVSASRRADDVVNSTHCGHGHVLAKGADMAANVRRADGARERLQPGSRRFDAYH